MASNFYLHISAVSKATVQPPVALHYGPFTSVEEAQAKHRELTHEPGYEYTVRINQEPTSN
jgi:hypothetical protein